MRLAVRLLLAAWADMRRWVGERVDVGSWFANDTDPGVD